MLILKWHGMYDCLQLQAIFSIYSFSQSGYLRIVFFPIKSTFLRYIHSVKSILFYSNCMYCTYAINLRYKQNLVHYPSTWPISVKVIFKITVKNMNHIFFKWTILSTSRMCSTCKEWNIYWINHFNICCILFGYSFMMYLLLKGLTFMLFSWAQYFVLKSLPCISIMWSLIFALLIISNKTISKVRFLYIYYLPS